MSATAVILGTDQESSEPVVLPQPTRLLGTYLIGANGTGKTTLIEHLITQDIAQGFGLCVLDPHGDLIEAVLQRGVSGRAEDVILWDLANAERPFGLNLFACEDPNDEFVVGRLAEELVQVFKKVWGEGDTASWGPRLEDLLRNVAVTLISNPGMTLLEVPRLLSDRAFRDELGVNVTSPAVADFWRYEYDPETDKEQREHRASTLNKVRSFLINPIVRNIVGQSQSSLDIPAIMAEGKVLLVKLAFGQVGALPVSLLGSVLVAQCFNAAMARVGTTHRPQFNLYLDEYHRFATPAVSELLTEVRKFGVATTIAHQARYQLDEANRGASLQAGTMIVFRVGAPDAEELAGQFGASPPAPIVIGERSKRVVSRQPVQDLLKHGAPTERAAEYVKMMELAEMAHWASSLTGEGWVEITVASRLFSHASRLTLQQGLFLINEFLVDAGEGQRSPLTKAADRTWVLDLVWKLRGWLGLADEKPERILDYGEIAYFTSIYTDYKIVQRFVTELLTVPPTPTKAETDAYMRAVAQALKAGTSMPKPLSHGGLRDIAKGAVVEGWLNVHFDAGDPPDPNENLRARLVPLVEELARGTQIDPTLDEERSFYRQLWRVIDFVYGLVLLGLELKQHPIMVPGTELEPIYDKPRSYADVQAQIANELVNLPRFTARCKVQGTEHTIRTIPPPAMPDGPLAATAAAEIAAVRERSRRAFGTPRQEVLAAIEARQQLRAMAEPNHEDEPPPPEQPQPRRRRWDRATEA